MWTHESTSCLFPNCCLVSFPVIVGCVRPSTVQHGSTNLTETNRSSFPVGTVLEYRCDSGYVPDGPNILTCSAMGHWSSEPPRCIRSDGKGNIAASNKKLTKFSIVHFYLT